MGDAVVAWAAFWLVPTEVVGKGVLLLPDNAGLLDARAAGQVRRLPIRVGDRVQRGQVLVELYLPVLEKELEQHRANLRELERQNRSLDERDRLRLQSEQVSVDTSLAKLQSDRERYGSLRDTYASKLRRLDWLTRREVVAPLSSEVVSTEQGLTTAGVNLDQVRIEQKKMLTAYQQVKLAIETEALQRLQPGPVQTEVGLQIGQGAGHGQPLVLKFRALVTGEGLDLVEAEWLNTSLAESCPERDGQGRGLRPLFIQGHWTPGVWVGPQQGRPDGGRGSRELRPRRRGCQQLVQQLDVLVELGPGALQLADARLPDGWLGLRRRQSGTEAAGEADRQQAWGQETPGDYQRGLAGFRGIRRARASWAGPDPAPRLPPGRAGW
jgi:hypothetical protein